MITPFVFNFDVITVYAFNCLVYLSFLPAPLKGSRIADGSANALLPGVASAASIWDENSELTSLGSFITWPSGPSSEVSFKKKAWFVI